MEDTRMIDLVVKGFEEVMDFMQEDDDLIAPSADPLVHSGNQMNEFNFDFSESMKGLTLADSTEIEIGREQVSQLSDSLDSGAKNTIRKCNLRKSLAWDSAFFTSAGVLDPEELSSMIGGAEIGGTKVLPVIQEDDMRSSVSTLEGDTLTLESLEAELFQDIRASIQKSSKVTSDIPPSNMSTSLGERHISIPSLTKTDHSSESKAKLALKSTPTKLHTSATESLNKKNQSCPEVTKGNSDDRCKETYFSRTKLQNGPGKLSAIPPPAKRVYASANHIANEKNVPKRLISNSSARGAPLAKLPASSKPALPRPTTASKISASVSVKATKKEHSVVRSSAESSSSVPSRNSVKFPVDSLKKKIASKTTKPPASTATVRIPSRTISKGSNPAALKTKVEPPNSRLSAYVKSTTTNISTSPASSISDWSIKSFSSTSTVNQRACAEGSPVSTSGVEDGHYPLALHSQVQSQDSNIGSDAPTITSTSNYFMSEPKTHSSLPQQVAAKPSGLRMPSPKIGFFDGVKSLARTPKRAVQLNRGMVKEEGICSPTGGSSHAISKIQSQTTTSSPKKDGARPAASITKHVPHIPGRKLPNSSMKKPSILEAANCDPSILSKLKKDECHKTGGKCLLNPPEVSTEVLEGKSPNRFSRQKNDKRIGVLSGGEEGTNIFYSSLPDYSAHNSDKVVLSKIDLSNFESLVEKNEVDSETKVSLKSSLEADREDLHFKTAPGTIGRTCNEGETATEGHKTHENNSIVNSDSGSNHPVTSSAADG